MRPRYEAIKCSLCPVSRVPYLVCQHLISCHFSHQAQINKYELIVKIELHFRASAVLPLEGRGGKIRGKTNVHHLRGPVKWAAKGTVSILYWSLGMALCGCSGLEAPTTYRQRGLATSYYKRMEVEFWATLKIRIRMWIKFSNMKHFTKKKKLGLKLTILRHKF